MVWSDSSIIKSSMRNRRVVNRLGRTRSTSFRLFRVISRIKRSRKLLRMPERLEKQIGRCEPAYNSN